MSTSAMEHKEIKGTASHIDIARMENNGVSREQWSLENNGDLYRPSAFVHFQYQRANVIRNSAFQFSHDEQWDNEEQWASENKGSTRTMSTENSGDQGQWARYEEMAGTMAQCKQRRARTMDDAVAKMYDSSRPFSFVRHEFMARGPMAAEKHKKRPLKPGLVRLLSTHFLNFSSPFQFPLNPLLQP